MSVYGKLKVAELKDLVKERGLSSTGLKLKQHFIDALVADDGKHDNGHGFSVEVAGRENAEAPEVDVPHITVKNDAEVRQVDGAESAAAAADAPKEDDRMDLSTANVRETDLAQLDGPDEREADKRALDNVDARKVVHEKPGNVDAASSDSEARKRKRRSPTPPVRPASVNKKLKSAEEKSGNAPLAQFQSTVVHGEEDAVDYGDEETDDDVHTTLPAAAEESGAAQIADEAHHLAAEPAVHPPTRAVYIRNLVRPLKPHDFQHHLQTLTTTPGAASAATAIEHFYVDKLRTHAFVTFKTVAAATRVRNQLHNVTWPPEANRKPLWVDFVPEAQVPNWIKTETEHTDMSHWAVLYNTLAAGQEDQETGAYDKNPKQYSFNIKDCINDDKKDDDDDKKDDDDDKMDGDTDKKDEDTSKKDDDSTKKDGDSTKKDDDTKKDEDTAGPKVIATHTKVDRDFAQTTRRMASFDITAAQASNTSIQAGNAPPGAPLGPRADQPPGPPPQHAPGEPPAPKYPDLGDKFKLTTAEPRLFWAPVDKELSDRRLANMAAKTSPDWDDADANPANYREGEMNRYTFEGDRLVNGGPDMGVFGRRRGTGRGRGGRGGGFARGGGYGSGYGGGRGGGYGGGYGRY